MQDDYMSNTQYIMATQDELLWIRHVMPKGMLKMVEVRTGKSRAQVRYQLYNMPENQDAEIITAIREILYVVTRKKYSVND